MPLVADYSSSSSSSSNSSSEEDNIEERKPKAMRETKDTKPKLPSATQLLMPENSRSISDVFKNPFQEAESAKIAVLEKHVKMVNKNEHIVEKNGRKICWNYRKGRCRFGSKCNYAHDSDLSVDQSKESMENFTTTSHTENVSSSQHDEHQKSAAIHELQDHTLNESSSCSTNTSSTKRKRPGLSDSITPSKKVIKSYTQEKQQKASLS